MLGKLFKPHWQHAKAEVRLKAVALLDLADPAQQDILTKLAKGDCNIQVRCRAISRINDLSVLQKLASRDAEQQAQNAAKERQLELLAGHSQDSPSLDNRLRAIRLLQDPVVLTRLLEEASDSPCWQAALDNLDDQQAFARLALTGRDANLREQAARKVSTHDLLRQLAREGRDKKVVQYARDTLKQQQAAQQQQATQQQQLDELLQQLQQHAKRNLDPLYEARLLHLQEQWQSLAGVATAAQGASAESCLNAAKQKLKTQLQQRQQQQAETAAQTQRKQCLAAFTDFFAQLDEDAWQGGINALASAFASLESSWQDAISQFPATPAETQEQQALSQKWQHLKQLYLSLESLPQQADSNASSSQLNDWPNDVCAPKWLTQRQQRLMPSGEQTASSSKTGKPHQRARHGGLLRQLRQSLKERQLKDANRAWQRLAQALEKHPDDNSASQAHSLKPQLDELRDWHAFAADPKKDELCGQMQALADTPLAHPEEQANAIQALQEQWHELMSGNQSADQSLWDRFKQASDAAYDHCRDYFRELDAKRAKMLAVREDIYQQLHDFLAQQDWDKADGNALWQIRCQAPKDWQAASPVRFTDARDINQCFHQLLKQFDAQLEQLSSAHQPRLEALLAQLDSASQEADNDKATHTAKQLQRQWREAGWVHPQQFRKLDKRKRQLCDAIFAKQQLALKLEQDKQQQLAHDLQQELDQLKGLLDAPSQNIEQLDAAMSQLQRQAEPNQNRALRQQKEALLKRANSSRQQQLRQQQWQQWQQLLEQVPAADSNDALRELCIAMEVSAACPSPEAEREQRLAWQVKHLASAMKSERPSSQQACTKLLEEAHPLLQAGVDADSRKRLLCVLASLIDGD